MEIPSLDIEVVLLDIEGTVCSISFVKDVLFPYALSALQSILPSQWDSPAFTPYRDAFPPEYRTTPSIFLSHVQDLIKNDIKIAYLKNLQGYLWIQGYESGEIKCPLFSDVYENLRKWRSKGKEVVIYSSGSVEAQKLLFRYTNVDVEEVEGGDLRGLIGGYFDTVNAGFKGESGSYRKIAGSRKGVEVGRWLFLSDRVEEVNAAKEAGMNSFVVVREGNVPLSEEEKRGQVLIKSFDEVKINGV